MEQNGYDAVTNFHQPEKGYRFSMDSILLAKFVRRQSQSPRILDLGAGCGVVGLAALEEGRLAGVEEMVFVEIQEPLVEAMRSNIDLYQPRTGVRLRPLHLDWRELSPAVLGGGADYIMVNPPYFNSALGQPSPNFGRARARHETAGGFNDLCAAVARVLNDGGHVAVVFPAERLSELVITMSQHFIVPRRLRLVHPKLGVPASLVLFEGELMRGDLVGAARVSMLVEPPEILSPLPWG